MNRVVVIVALLLLSLVHADAAPVRKAFTPVLTDGTTALPLIVAEGTYTQHETGLIEYQFRTTWGGQAPNPLSSSNLRLMLPCANDTPTEGVWVRAGWRGVPAMTGAELSGAWVMGENFFRFYWTGFYSGAGIPVPGSSLNTMAGGIAGVIIGHCAPAS